MKLGCKAAMTSIVSAEEGKGALAVLSFVMEMTGNKGKLLKEHIQYKQIVWDTKLSSSVSDGPLHTEENTSVAMAIVPSCHSSTTGRLSIVGLIYSSTSTSVLCCFQNRQFQEAFHVKHFIKLIHFFIMYSSRN